MRHHDVEAEQIGPMLFPELESLPTVARKQRAEPLGLDAGVQRFERDRIIICEEEPHWGAVTGTMLGISRIGQVGACRSARQPPRSEQFTSAVLCGSIPMGQPPAERWLIWPDLEFWISPLVVR